MRYLLSLLATLCALAAGQTNVSIGTAANDGTGDTLRSAFSKVNTNFTEVYSALRSGFLLIGTTNSTLSNAVVLELGGNVYFTTNGSTVTLHAIGVTNGGDYSFNSDQFVLVTATNLFIKSGAALTNTVLVTPTIASFEEANHSHTNDAGGGTLDASAIGSGTIADARIGTNVIRFNNIDKSSEVAAILDDETGTGALVFGTSPTITTPTLTSPYIADFSNSKHTHLADASGGALSGSAIASGLVGETYISPLLTRDIELTAALTAATNWPAINVSGVLGLQAFDLVVTNNVWVTNDLHVVGELDAGGEITGASANITSIGSTYLVTSNLTASGTAAIDAGRFTNAVSVGGALTADSGRFTNDVVMLGELDVTGEITAANVQAPTLSSTLITSSNITATGTGSFAAVTTDALAVDGSDTIELSLPLLYTDLSGGLYRHAFGFSGASTNGTNVSLWSVDVPNAHTLKVHADFSADMTNHFGRGDVLNYEFRRADTESASLSWTNHLRSLTNHWMSLSGNTVTLWCSATNNAVLSTRGFGWWITNNIVDIDVAWSPANLWDFEETGAPAGWFATEVGQTDWDNTSSPLNGAQQVRLTCGASSAAIWTPAMTAASEIWVSVRVRASDLPDVAVPNLINIRNGAGTDRCGVSVKTNGKLYVTPSGGSASSDSGVALADGAERYVLLRYVASSGDAYLYVTSDPADWGSPVSSTDGTGTDDVRYASFGVSNNWGAADTVDFDDVIWSTEAIPAGYYD